MAKRKYDDRPSIEARWEKVGKDKDGEFWRTTCLSCGAEVKRRRNPETGRRPRYSDFCDAKCKGAMRRQEKADQLYWNRRKHEWRVACRQRRNAERFGPEFTMTPHSLEESKRFGPAAFRELNPDWIRPGEPGWDDPEFYADHKCVGCGEPVQMRDATRYGDCKYHDDCLEARRSGS